MSVHVKLFCFSFNTVLIQKYVMYFFSSAQKHECVSTVGVKTGGPLRLLLRHNQKKPGVFLLSITHALWWMNKPQSPHQMKWYLRAVAR